MKAFTNSLDVQSSISRRHSAPTLNLAKFKSSTSATTLATSACSSSVYSGSSHDDRPVTDADAVNVTNDDDDNIGAPILDQPVLRRENSGNWEFNPGDYIGDEHDGRFGARLLES